MNISQLAKLNAENGGFFFSPEKRKDEPLRCFRIVRQNVNHLVLGRKKDMVTWVFDKKTGRVIHNVEPESVVKVGDMVDVKHKPDDAFNHDFTGRVILIGEHIRVRDQEDDAWDVDTDQVTLA